MRRRGRRITGCRVCRRLGGRGDGRRGGRRDGLRFGRRASSRESALARLGSMSSSSKSSATSACAVRPPPRPPGSAAPAPRVRARDAPRRAAADRRRAPPLRPCGGTGAAVRVRGAASTAGRSVVDGYRRRGDGRLERCDGLDGRRDCRRRRHEELVGDAIVFRDPPAPDLGPDVVAAARGDDREVLAWELRHRRQLVLHRAELVERVLQLDRQQLGDDAVDRFERQAAARQVDLSGRRRRRTACRRRASRALRRRPGRSPEAARERGSSIHAAARIRHDEATSAHSVSVGSERRRPLGTPRRADLVDANHFDQLVAARLVRRDDPLGPQVLQHPLVAVVGRADAVDRRSAPPRGPASVIALSVTVRDAGQHAEPLDPLLPLDGRERRRTARC